MKTYKAEIFKMVDLENSKHNHVVISGGKATHSFYHVTNLTAETLEKLLDDIKSNFGEIYDHYENRLSISIPEDQWEESECPENYEAYISAIEETQVSEDELETLINEN